MPNYSYVAVDKQGKESKGSVKMESTEEVKAFVKSEGKTLISVKETKASNGAFSTSSSFQKKPKLRDLAVFCRQFVSISAAGVPVISAFEMLSTQTENKMLAQALNDCCLGIRSGFSLTESMRQHSEIFPELLITMVSAGEASGSLDIAFSRMGEQFEKEEKLRSTIKRASIYPIAVCIIATGVVMLLLAFVIPEFETMLNDLGTEIPLPTQIVIAMGLFMETNWPFVILGIFLAVGGLRSFAKTPRGKSVFSNIQLRMPLYRGLAIKTASARMSRTMSSLIAAGIPLIEVIEIVSETMTNVRFREALVTARDDVSMGAPLSETFTRSKMFPPLVCHMTKVGEEAGDMEGMLSRLADYYDEEVEVTTATIMAAMEPALIVILALVVGGIVSAVIIPLSTMYESLNTL